MSQETSQRAKALAQNLVELLSSYEEELMALERETPAIGQLRRAVGIAIAEACYVITDQGLVETEWAPPSDGSTRSAG
jgi:biotin synthase-related radical SAM superfamily protein